MFTFRWVQIYSFLTLIFPFKGKNINITNHFIFKPISDKNWHIFLLSAAAGEQHSSLAVRVGDGATLPCESLTPAQHNCDITAWTFTGLGGDAVTLVEHGLIHKETRAAGLSVRADCALVIEKVRGQDVGQYSCRQLTAGGAHAHVHLSHVHLSVIHSEYLYLSVFKTTLS